jgi:hypothetical protein
VTAAVITLALAAAASMVGLVALVVWYRNALRSIDEQRVLAEGYRSDRDEGVRQLKVAAAELTAERKLRVAAELQRNQAATRLREQMAHLPPEEIERIAASVFGTPLSVTPGNELEKP